MFRGKQNAYFYDALKLCVGLGFLSCSLWAQSDLGSGFVNSWGHNGIFQANSEIKTENFLSETMRFESAARLDHFQRVYTSQPLEAGPTLCLQTQKDYLITIEVRRNEDGTCYRNPVFDKQQRIVNVFEKPTRYGYKECYATLWAPVIPFDPNKNNVSDSFEAGGIPCNGRSGPGCYWHDEDEGNDFLFFKIRKGGYTQNALLHDMCMAYSFYDPENNFEKREEFQSENNPINTILNSKDMEYFEKEIQPEEICYDEFSWAIYDITGESGFEIAQRAWPARRFTLVRKALKVNTPSKQCDGTHFGKSGL